MKYAGIIILILVVVALIWGVFFNNQQESNIEGNQVTEQKDEETELFSENQEPEGDTVVLNTTHGEIKIQVNKESAPNTSNNFLKLVSEGFYDGLTFHRVVPGFVIQGGDPLGNGSGGPGYTLPAEISLKHERGAIAMARLPDQVNPQKQSSGSQFYIALQSLPSLDGEYTVFAKVVEGMEVVDSIAQTQTDENDKPTESVIIEKAIILTEEQKD